MRKNIRTLGMLIAALSLSAALTGCSGSSSTASSSAAETTKAAETEAVTEEETTTAAETEAVTEEETTQAAETEAVTEEETTQAAETEAVTEEETTAAAETEAAEEEETTEAAEEAETTQAAAVEAAPEGYHNVVLHYNDGTTPDEVLQVKDNGRAMQPDNPEWEGNRFNGWYTDEACTEKFVFSTKITEDTDLYASWLGSAVFEAENLYLEDNCGPGYSGAAYDYSMIVQDKYGAGASGGAFVSYLYASYDNSQYNTTLEFHVTSDQDVTGAVLVLRLSAEYADITINGDTYEVLVNGAKINYSDITFTGAADATQNSSLLPFEDYTVSSSVALSEGDNVITLRTANTTRQGSGGTMVSTAPVVDCIKISASGANLTWTEGWTAED